MRDMCIKSGKKWLKDSNLKKEREQNDEKSREKKNRTAVFTATKCQKKDMFILSRPSKTAHQHSQMTIRVVQTKPHAICRRI